ncbi:MAG TPA: hypothetical protein VNR00_15645 [Opitutus sp.]|nr:hypothetical protein [Opitutus sp.]
MKKALLYLLFGLLALVLIAYVAGYFFLGSIVKAGVNNVGPKVTQTKVELGGATISPVTGSGTLSNLAVGNPAGWSDANAFYLGRVHVEVAPASLLSDTIVIDDLVIENPELTYETRVVASNIGDLLKNIEASVGGKDQPQDQNAKPRKFIVKHFKLADGKVTLGVGPAALPLPLPGLELNDLGVKEGGLTAGQLSVAVVRQVLTNVVAATTRAGGKIGGTMGAAAGDAAKKAGEGLKKLLGGDKTEKK